MPTSCSAPFEPSVTADSWAQPEALTAPVFYSLKTPLGEPLGLDGCNRMPFSTSISVAPDSSQGSTPSGLTVGIHVPQEEALNAEGLAPSSVKDTTVTLPAGVALNPSGADGLLACSTAQIGLSSPAEQECPSSSKVGTVEIHTPLLPNPLVGAAYLATQDENPFGSLVALYLEVYDPVSGVRVKLAGEVKPDPVTGQLVSTFDNTPQLPFEDLTLHFFGGSRAPLGTPALCGAYTTTASIAPWSGNAPAQSSSVFDVTSGPNGSPCATRCRSAPSLTTGSLNLQAGAFTPFTMTMSREDGQQNLDAVQLKMPAGLLGTLTGVKLCQESQADQGTCGEESLIGHTIVSVGLGGNPYTVTGGRVYLTGPYEGAPFGLSIVNPAKAGPFDLGQVVVRAKIEVDPITSALTITTDRTGPYAIPQILDGIPLQIKHVNVSIDRANFTFNPTDCQPTQIGGSLTSSQKERVGAARPVPGHQLRDARLQTAVRGLDKWENQPCQRREPARPAVLSESGVRYTGEHREGQGRPAKATAFAGLSTLQKACTAQTFEANPASCPASSKVGEAKATTPIIPEELHGPAYFVSYGGAKFPELVIVLSGYGVTVQTARRNVHQRTHERDLQHVPPDPGRPDRQLRTDAAARLQLGACRHGQPVHDDPEDARSLHRAKRHGRKTVHPDRGHGLRQAQGAEEEAQEEEQAQEEEMRCVQRPMVPRQRMATGASARTGDRSTPRELPQSLRLTQAEARARERVNEIQRSRILAAMVEECAARGSGNVTVAHVVSRAGVSRRTFYELFEDREDCFVAAFDEGIASAARYVLDGYDAEARWVERVRTALVGLLTFIDLERGVGELLVVGSLAAGARALERRRDVLTRMMALVDEGRSEIKAGAELPPLTAEGVVGGVLSVLHSRLHPPVASSGEGSTGDAECALLDLAGPLMSMIVLPYLGPAAARQESARPVLKPSGGHRPERNPLGELEMRLTYRTVRVLMAIATHPGSSNRVIAEAAEVTDQGQMSKLLTRLHDIGLIENTGGGAVRGEPNAWTLTEKGWRVQGAIAEQT